MTIVAYLLTLLLVLSAAWSIEDARWILGRHELTGFLGVVAFLSTSWGAATGLLRWPRRVAHPLGAIVAALVLPVLIGWIIAPMRSIPEAYAATSRAVIEAYLDLAWRGRSLTPQVGHYMLTLAGVVWATGIFAGYAVLGRRRPLDAIFVTGLVLLLNMSLTALDQLHLLVLFSAAALLLLVRGHASDEVSLWLRDRLGDTGDVTSLYVRGGIAFVAAAIVGSLVLTSTASSAPLANAWVGIQQRFIDVAARYQRFFPQGGPGTRLSGVAFGDSATISGQWVTDDTVAATLETDPSYRPVLYWRAVAYDTFELFGWAASDTIPREVPASSELGVPPPDGVAIEASGRTTITYSVTPDHYGGAQALTVGVPRTLSVGSTLRSFAGGSLSELDRAGDGRAGYTVTATIWKLGDAAGGLTENRLRSAGTRYPPEIRDPYLAFPDGSLGPNARALRDAIVARAPHAEGVAPTPYDIAKTTERYLRSTQFQYDTNVTDIRCDASSVVECFATFRRGYCQHYASTMTILLRSAGIPARFVQGFLPGRRDLKGVETIRTSAAHAWVEVWFPGYGWIPFDPTGGGVAQLGTLPAGAPTAGATDGTTGGSGGETSGGSGGGIDEPGGEPTPAPGGGTSGGGGGRGADLRGPLLGGLVGLLALLAVMAFAVYRRVPGAGSPPEIVFGRVARIAARLGFARRPSETVYEYAGALAEAVPTARVELRSVADATVEVAYGRASIGPERARALRDAEGRIRVALLRLLLRRTGRRRGG